MAVLLITYKYNPKTSQADYERFNQVIRNYRWVKSQLIMRLPQMSPPGVWHKLKAHIDPDDYFVMLTFKSGSWSLKDQKILAWLVEQPLKIEL